MKKIVYLLMIFSLYIYGGCLKVGDKPISTCHKNSIEIQSISNNFQKLMEVSDRNKEVLKVPLYLLTDVEDEVYMSIRDIQKLQNLKKEEIETRFEYIQGNIRIPIYEGKEFKLLSSHQDIRDGKSIIGYISIIVKNLSPTQTAGYYDFIKEINVRIGNSSSSSNTFKANGKVAQVSMIGFKELSSIKRGKAFIEDVIAFGNFSTYSINQLIKNIFVKNNMLGDLEIQMETKGLVNQSDSNYKLDMNYFYQENGKHEIAIENNKFFTITSGKKGGGQIGRMRFVVKHLPKMILAGEYKANITAIVRAK